MNWGPLESVRDIRECLELLGIVESVRERFKVCKGLSGRGREH